MSRTCLGLALTALLAGGAAAQARPAASAMEGIYFGLRTDMLSNRVYPDYYTFLADGRVFRGDPSEGLGRPIDWEQECRYAECGTYTKSGAVVRMRSRSGTETVFDLDAQGVLRRRGRAQSFRRMHILDGIRLDGSYGQVDEERNDTLTVIHFGADGRFRERGLLRRSAWVDLGDEGENRSHTVVDAGSGTYAIRRGTLELRYDRGPTAYLLLVAPPGVNPRPAPATVYVNRLTLNRLR